MTNNELVKSIRQASKELHEMIENIYHFEMPSNIERDLVKQKCAALYELLLKEVEEQKTTPLIEEEILAPEPKIEIPALPLQIPILANDIPSQEPISEIIISVSEPTPTEQLNLEIDAVLETQNTIVEDKKPIPQSVANELSLHEKIANSLPPQNALADKLVSIPSLKNAINVNLKIAIVNQLFNENTVEYVKSIDKLNSSENIHEAMRYFTELKHTYNWSNENDLAKELEQLIQKRFV